MPRGDHSSSGSPRRERKTGWAAQQVSKQLKRRLNDDRAGEINWSKETGPRVDRGKSHMIRPGSQH